MIGTARASNPDSPITVTRQRVPWRYRQRHRGRLTSSLSSCYFKKFIKKKSNFYTKTFLFMIVSRCCRRSSFQEIFAQLFQVLFQWLHLPPGLLFKYCTETQHFLIHKSCSNWYHAQPTMPATQGGVLPLKNLKAGSWYDGRSILKVSQTYLASYRWDEVNKNVALHCWSLASSTQHTTIVNNTLWQSHTVYNS